MGCFDEDDSCFFAAAGAGAAAVGGDPKVGPSAGQPRASRRLRDHETGSDEAQACLSGPATGSTTAWHKSQTIF